MESVLTAHPHTPVLLSETVRGTINNPSGIYVDATLGMGGHSEYLLENLNHDSLVIGFDVDPEAIGYASDRLSRFSNFIAVQQNFSRIKVELYRLGYETIDGILYDLGVSSLMLDKTEKGFSYQTDSQLDMRMSPSLELTAYEIVNTWEPTELSRIFYEYGEERASKAIANSIVEERMHSPIESSSRLSEIIARHSHPKFLNKTLSRIFQALRIAVNNELTVLERSIDHAMQITKPGGRISVIAYHSLEDRIVKTKFTEACTDCVCPPEIPVCVCKHHAIARWIIRKPVTASDAETMENPRARSAKLRIIERI